MSGFRAITYVSSVRWKPSSTQLEQTLSESRQQNRDHGITGVLLYHDGSFMQYIEGLDAATTES
jgi:hypothetical protein